MTLISWLYYVFIFLVYIFVCTFILQMVLYMNIVFSENGKYCCRTVAGREVIALHGCTLCLSTSPTMPTQPIFNNSSLFPATIRHRIPKMEPSLHTPSTIKTSIHFRSPRMTSESCSCHVRADHVHWVKWRYYAPPNQCTVYKVKCVLGGEDVCLLLGLSMSITFPDLSEWYLDKIEQSILVPQSSRYGT